MTTYTSSIGGVLPQSQGGTGTATFSPAAVPVITTIGSPASLTDLNQQLNHLWSAGVVDGAAITDNMDGTVNVASGTCMIRQSISVSSLTRSGSTATVVTSTPHGFNSQESVAINGASQAEYNGLFLVTVTAPDTFTYTVSGSPATPATGTIFAVDSHSQLYTAVVPAVTNLALTDHYTNYVYVDYNMGSPQYVVTTDGDSIFGLARVLVWTVAREGSTLWILDNRATNVDPENRSDALHTAIDPFAHAVGGSVLSASGTRNIAVTAGSFFVGLNEIPHPAFDTSASSTFTTAYVTSGTWTFTAGQTQISNTQYNNVTTGLASLTSGYYGVFWVYIANNSPSALIVVYGQGDYATKAAARASSPPTLPNSLTGVCALIGRIVIEQGASSFLDTSSTFTYTFPYVLALNGLSDVSSPDTPTTGDILRFNGAVWANAQPTTASAATGQTYYYATPVITATGTGNAIAISTLSATPVTTAEQTVTGTTTAGVTTAYSARLGDTALGRTSIPAGSWDFTVWASIDSATGTTTVTSQIYKVTPYTSPTVTMTGTGTTRTATASSGTPFATANIDASATNTDASYLMTASGIYQISARTSDTVVTIITPTGYVNDSAVAFNVFKKLFGNTSADFAGTATQLLSFPTTTQAAFTCATTDKIGSINFLTCSAGTRTITTYYNGTAHSSGFRAPFIVLHNDLPGLQGGTSTQYYHLTSNEYTGNGGSGNFIRDTNATLTTPALGTPSALVGTNITGTASGLSIGGNAVTATNATNTTNIAIADDTTTNATMYPTWVTANTGNLPAKVSSTKVSFNPSTGLYSSVAFNASTGATGYQINSVNGISYPAVDSGANSTIAVGKLALANLSASSAAYFNTAIGDRAMGASAGNMTTAAVKNVAIGSLALSVVTSGNNNVAIGHLAAGANATTITQSVYVGSESGRYKTSGNANVGVGFDTLLGDSGTPANNTGATNVAIGASAGKVNSTASNNVFVGANAGTATTSGGTNTFIGANAGDANTTGTDNIIIGYNQDASSAGATNELNIGGAIKATGLGTTNAVTLPGTLTVTGAARGAFSTLTDGATVTVDMATGNNFKLQLGGNRTLGVPTNIVAGQSGHIDIYQDATGSRTLAYAWPWMFAGGTAPTLSTAGCSKDALYYDVTSYATSAVTITIATPGVVSWTGHGLVSGQRLQLTTTGALPTGLTAATTYWVVYVDANSFSLATTLANAAAGTKITTSGTQSGTHTATAIEISTTLNKAFS